MPAEPEEHFYAVEVTKTIVRKVTHFTKAANDHGCEVREDRAREVKKDPKLMAA